MKTKPTFIIFSLVMLFASCVRQESTRTNGKIVQTSEEKAESVYVVESEIIIEGDKLKERESRRITFEYTEPIKGFRVRLEWKKPVMGKCKGCGFSHKEHWRGLTTISFTCIENGRTLQFYDCGLLPFREFLGQNECLPDAQHIYISEFQVPEVNRNELELLDDILVHHTSEIARNHFFKGNSRWGLIDLNGDGQYTLVTAFNYRGTRGSSTVRFFSLATGRELTNPVYGCSFVGGCIREVSIDFRNRRFVVLGRDNIHVYSYSLNHNNSRLTVRLLKTLQCISNWRSSDFYENDREALHTFFRDSGVETQRPVPDDFWWNQEKDHTNGYFDGWNFRRVNVVSQIRETYTWYEWEDGWLFNLENVYRGL